MNRYARWGFALVLLPVAACADKPASAPMTPPAPPPLAAADASFIQEAAMGGLTEIQEAQLAQSVSHNPRVKAYAAHMITDHTAANDQLKQIALSKGATVPTAPSDMQMQEMTTLKAETGRKFDHDYIADQVAGHQQMVQLFTTEASGGTDADLKKFASDTLPTVQAHLDSAKSMQSSGHGHMMHHKKTS